MRSEPARVATAMVLATLLLLVALGIGAVDRATTLAAYLLVLAAIGVASLLRTFAGTPDIRSSPLEHALARQPDPRPRPPDLVRVERELTLGVANAGHMHRRLAPMLRDVAFARLGGRLTRERLGDEAWELLRPDREEPADPYAPGPSLNEIRRVVARLEQL